MSSNIYYATVYVGGVLEGFHVIAPCSGSALEYAEKRAEVLFPYKPFVIQAVQLITRDAQP
jgi:hypothetical protein